jgi:polysaccharide biosynthesis protein PslH
MISRNLPYPLVSGEKIRVFNLIKGLAANHEVILLTPISDRNERELLAELRRICSDVHEVLVPSAPRSLRTHAAGLFSRVPYHSIVMPSPGLGPRLSELVQRGRYDLIQVETLAAAHWVARVDGLPKVLDTINVDSVYFRRQVRFLRPGIRQVLLATDAMKLPSYERRLMPQFDRCLAVSELDAGRLRRLAPGANVSVIANGVAPEDFRPCPMRERPLSLLFVGSFAYLPNTDAALFFCREVLPAIRATIPEVRVVLAGLKPPPEVTALRAVAGVDVAGTVPDIRPYLAAAAVVVAPVRLGSGTRVKILEAMAMGKAVVSTTIGVEGLAVRSGRDVEIADRPGEFAARVIELLRDPERRARLGSQARQTILREYSWDAIVARLESVYDEILLREPSGDGARGRQSA